MVIPPAVMKAGLALLQVGGTVAAAQKRKLDKMREEEEEEEDQGRSKTQRILIQKEDLQPQQVPLPTLEEEEGQSLDTPEDLQLEGVHYA
jgi:hypothetical protein